MATDYDLTVVIVNWNTRDLLRACLHSIYKGTSGLKLEVIVVDNCSSDDSVEIVRRKFSYVNVVANQRNLGFAAANNIAIKAARSKYILLLNPDTVVLNGALEVLLSFLQDNPWAGAVGPRVLQPDGRLQKSCRRSIPTPAVAFWKLFGLNRLFPKSRRFARYNLTYLDPDLTAEVGAISGSCMAIRKAVIEQVGLLDDRFFMYGEDLDLCYRLGKAGWSIFYLPQAEIIHFGGQGSRQRKMKSVYHFYQAMWFFHKKHFAGNYPFCVNVIILAGIILRGTLAMMAALFKSRRPKME